MEDLLISSKISHLLENGAIEKVDMSQLHYSNSLFLVAKRSGGGKAGNKSPTFKQICFESNMQDGEHFTSERNFETKQFSHRNRLKSCFLQHPFRQKVKKVPSVYLPQQTLSILCPTIRNFNSSSSVFQDSKACYCYSPHKRHISHYLSRRSTRCIRDIIDCLSHTKQVISLLES